MIENDLERIADALDRIAALLYIVVSDAVPTTEEPTTVPEPAPKKTRAPWAKAKADPVPEPEPAPEPEPEPEPEPAVPPSADELRARMRAIAALAPGNRDKIIAAMQSFGVSNFAKLGPEKYPAMSLLLDIIEGASKP